MAGQIKVNTDAVADIANSIEASNERLTTLLEESKQSIDNLKNTWEGEAANATVEAYQSFAAKYFESYHDIIASYVSFLRTNVEQGYFDTETANINLADAFK